VNDVLMAVFSGQPTPGRMTVREHAIISRLTLAQSPVAGSRSTLLVRGGESFYGLVLMARFHRAVITPTKEELIADWAPRQSWGPPAGGSMDVVGSYRFDDPDGRVGMEVFLVDAQGLLVHVPLTYRDEPLPGADDALICEMEHSVLGTRWVYDGLRDPQLVVMLAAVSMTGQGEALGMAIYEGRWYVAPTNVRIQGGTWTLERVPVDGFDLVSDEAGRSVLRNDRFELSVFRRPSPGPRPAIGLTATWDGQTEPVVLTEIVEPLR
jgi:Maltokinase N-terminal cap domain